MLGGRMKPLRSKTVNASGNVVKKQKLLGT